MHNKVYVTWSDIENWVVELADKLKDSTITGVYGLPRGGLIIATILSYRLNLPLLTAPHNNCLIVDDIADSGRSLLHYTNNDTQFNNYVIATYYYHPRSMVTPKWYCKLKNNDIWIVFPWEEHYEGQLN